MTVAQLRERATPEQGRGVYIAAVTRLETRCLPCRAPSSTAATC